MRLSERISRTSPWRVGGVVATSISFVLLFLAALASPPKMLLRADSVAIVSTTGATHAVMSTADNGPGTLRQALHDANAGDQVIFDPAVFPPANPATIVLTSELPALTQGNLTIDGGGAGVILDGGNIGATPESVLLDNISLKANGSVNLLMNGDFGAGLDHWRPDDERPGATRSLNVGDFPAGATTPSFDWATVAHAARSATIYDTIAGSDPFEDDPYDIDSTVWIPIGGGSTVVLEFWYKYGGLGAEMVTLFANGDDEDVAGKWFDYEPDWTKASITATMPAEATHIAFEFRFFHSKHWVSGIYIPSNGNIVRNLQLINFPNHGVDVWGGDGNTLSAMTIANNVGAGISLAAGASGNAIGGDNATPGGTCSNDCNAIYGNGWDGIAIRETGTDHNVVSGNHIGVDHNGATAIGNGLSDDGIGIREGPANNTIGGDTPGKRNLISGHGDNGIKIESAYDNVVMGNYLGTDATGALALPNREDNIALRGDASGNQIGGNAPGQGNFIASSLEAGIDIRDDSYHNSVSGNTIGLFAGDMPQVFPTDMAVAPGSGTDCTLLVATTSAGILKSTDCGDTWAPANGGLNTLSIKDVEIPPTALNGNTAYLLAVDGAVYKTQDGGNNWAQTGSLANADVQNLAAAADSATAPTLYAAAEWAWPDQYGGPGVFKSTDDGATWTRMVAGMSRTNVRMVLASPDPTDPNTLFALTEDSIERSTDGGISWLEMTRPDGELTDLAMSPGYGTDKTIFVSARDNKVHKSTDGGANWTEFSTPRGDPRYLALSPNYVTDGRVCHGGGWNDQIFCSVDGGATWVETWTGLPGGLDGAAAGLLFAPDYAAGGSGRIFMASNAGLVRSSDDGATWHLLRTLRNLGNRVGVRIGDHAHHNTIGPDNLISNNHRGIEFNDPDPNYNTLSGNLIGTDAAGTSALSNSGSGIVLHRGHHNVIGGPTATDRNIISGNQGNGIAMWWSQSYSITIQNNYIGTDIDGLTALGNRHDGIHINNTYNIWIVENLISGNNGRGLSLCCGSEARDNVIQGNKIGTNRDGTAAIGNGDNGIAIDSDAHRNRIGGSAPGEGNLISGNHRNGILLCCNADTRDNVIQGNKIGTNQDGTAAIPNRDNGIELADGVHNNLIGGTGAGQGNLISGNQRNGVNICCGSETRDNVIQGNKIGTDENGTSAIGNDHDGVFIGDGANNNTVGGSQVGGGNIISGNGRVGVSINGDDSGTRSNAVIGNTIGLSADGNTLGNGVTDEYTAVEIYYASDNTIADNIIAGNNGNGVTIQGNTSTGNLIRGNYIGTDDKNTGGIGNSYDGVHIQDGANGNTIGGPAAADRNIISGNGAEGVALGGPFTAGNHVINNHIGVDSTGSAPLGNRGRGIGLWSAQNTVSRNVISSNNMNGMDIWGRDAVDNIVEQNVIGASADGTTPLPNAWGGIAVGGGASNNMIGPGNSIAHNGWTGVYVGWRDAPAVENTITRNAIYANSYAGIFLEYGGNIELFAPIFESVGKTGVTGRATPGSTVEIFFDEANQGRIFDGATTADAGGYFQYSYNAVPGALNITATATDANGNTSAFSDGLAPRLDAAVENIFEPANAMALADTLIPRVKISNTGTTVAENVTVTLEISGPVVASERRATYRDTVIVSDIAPLSYRTVAFASFTPSGLGEYSFRATASLPGDGDGSNDQLIKKVQARDTRVDIWMRDHPKDPGTVPTDDWWQSPDIWVRNVDDGSSDLVHQNPISGTTNFVNLTIRNRAASLPAGPATVRVFWHEPSLGIACGDWAEIGVAAVDDWAADRTANVTMTWTPTRTGHTCLFAVLETPEDPVTSPCDVPYDNNIIQRNVEIIPVSPVQGSTLLASDSVAFDVANIYPIAKSVDVVIDRSAIPSDGTVELDLGDELFQRWQSVNGGTPLTGAEVKAGGSVIAVIDGRAATIHDIPLAADEARPVTLVITTPSATDAEVSVFERIDDNVIGGNTYSFSTGRTDATIYLPHMSR